MISPSHSRKRRRWPLAAYSLTEMIVVISGLGVLAGIVIPQIGDILGGSQEVVARQKIEMLNKGVKDHQHSSPDNLENLRGQAGATWDESRVLLQLQYRKVDNPSIGSPYIPLTYRPQMSSSTSDYRMEWTGSEFKLLPPGTAGSGIKVVFDGSDIGPPVTHPPTYKWSGR